MWRALLCSLWVQKDKYAHVHASAYPPALQKRTKRTADAAFQTSKGGVSVKPEPLSERICCLVSIEGYCIRHSTWHSRLLSTVMPRGGWSGGKATRHNISAVIRYLTAITVYVPRGHRVLPSCLLTCLLITKGHPAGTQCWPLNAKRLFDEDTSAGEGGSN